MASESLNVFSNNRFKEYEQEIKSGSGFIFGIVLLTAFVLMVKKASKRGSAQRVPCCEQKIFPAAQLCLIFYSRPTLLLERETLSGAELSGVLGEAVYFASKVEKDANLAEEALSFDAVANPEEAQVLYVRLEIAKGDNILSAKNVFELQERLKTKTQIHRVRIASLRDLSGKESFARV